MKRSPILADHVRESELIAIFGEARLVRTLLGKVEIRGGTEPEQQAAREWMELFLSPHTGRYAVLAAEWPK
ncbi:MAG: hypothetical protein JWR69_4451 [Pedosphaera sp.]|nr:hypothetical protein [Pedosphaera sp.]